VPARETRMVDPSRVSAHQRKYLSSVAVVAAAVAGPVVDALLVLLNLSVKELKARIADRNAVTAADLDKLEAAERAGKARRTALEAITEERLARARSGSGEFVVPQNLGELLDGDEEAVLANLSKLKVATEAETDPLQLTQEDIDGLEQAEQNGGKRENVLLAILELEAKDAPASGQGSGSDS
jgi:hypothetical protein